MMTSNRQGIVGAIGVNRRPSSWTHHLDAHLIKLGTFSRWNHAAVVTDVAQGMARVTEAAGGGVRHRWVPIHDPAWHWDRLDWITPEQRQTIAAEADKYLGWPYDYGDIARFIVRFFTAKVPGRGRQDYADGRVICSELVSWCLHVAGIDPWPDTAHGAVSPGDIADWMLTAA